MAFSLVSNASAQGIIEDETTLGATFENDQQQLNILNLQSNPAMSQEALMVANNGVFINQVGDNNTARVAARSQVSDIQLNQVGDLNRMNLNLRANVIDYQATQLGDNNLLLEYPTFGDKVLLERAIEQNGDNQNLIIHGRNGIIDKMQIRMGGDSRSLIIRNSN